MGLFDRLTSYFGGKKEQMPAERVQPEAPKRVEREKGEARFKTAEATEASADHPDRNEDSYLVDAHQGLLAVADGAGGHEGGEDISRLIVKELDAVAPTFVRGADGKPFTSVDAVSGKMDEGIKIVLKKAEGGARSTLIAAQIVEADDGRYAVVKSVGDSAGYIRKKDGTVKPVEIMSDGFLEQQINEGSVTKEDAELISDASSFEQFVQTLQERGRLNDEQAAFVREQKNASKIYAKYPSLAAEASLIDTFGKYYGRGRKLLTQAVGESADKLQIHTAVVKLEDGDEVILASDGVDDNLTRAEIQEALAGEGPIADRLQRLKQISFDRAKTVSKAAILERMKEKDAPQPSIRAKVDDVTAIALETPPAKPLSREYQNTIQTEERKGIEAAEQAIAALGK